MGGGCPHPALTSAPQRVREGEARPALAVLREEQQSTKEGRCLCWFWLGQS